MKAATTLKLITLSKETRDFNIKLRALGVDLDAPMLERLQKDQDFNENIGFFYGCLHNYNAPNEEQAMHLSELLMRVTELSSEAVRCVWGLSQVGITLTMASMKKLDNDPEFGRRSAGFEVSMGAYMMGSLTAEQAADIGELFTFTSGITMPEGALQRGVHFPVIRFAQKLQEAGIALDSEALDKLNHHQKFRSNMPYYDGALKSHLSSMYSQGQPSHMIALLNAVTGVSASTIYLAKHLAPLSAAPFDVDMMRVLDKDPHFREYGQHVQTHRFPPLDDARAKGISGILGVIGVTASPHDLQRGFSLPVQYFAGTLAQVGIHLSQKMLKQLDDKNSMFHEYAGRYLGHVRMIDPVKKIWTDSHAEAQVDNLLYAVRNEEPESRKKQLPISASRAVPIQPSSSWGEYALSLMPTSVQSWASYVGLQTSPSPSTSPPVQKVAAGR